MKKEKIEENLGNIKASPFEIMIEEYKKLFHAEFKDEVAGSASKEEGNYNLLAKAFEDIGDKYKEASASHEGKNTDTICRNFTDSLLHYQYAIQVLKSYVSDDYDISNLEAKVHELYVNFVKVIGSKQTSDAEPSKLLAALSHKEDIESLRGEVKARIESIQSIDKEREDYKPEYVSQSDALFRLTSKGMKEYLANIVKDAEKALGKPPCKYSVIGLGSMAMKQITPYSDLEFAIIVEEDSDKVQEYFLKFGHYINFAVTALGESPIAFNKYDIDFDKLSKIAVNLDLGGKTSLGREDKDYSLVCDIEGMVRNLKGEYDASTPKDRRDEKLPLILGNVCHVFGDSKLTKDYQSEANDFLLSPSGEGDLTNAQLRARDILSKDGISRKSNLDEFAFNPTEKEGHLFDVKQEIYRIPDRMIYNLGKLYNICQEDDGLSPLEIISKLEEGNYICSEAAENFRFAVSYANILRLRVYDFYGEQEEKIDSLPAAADFSKKNFRLNKDETCFSEDENQDGILLEYYYIILPLMDALSNLCSYSESNGKISGDYFKKSIFYDNSNKTKVSISMRLMLYDYTIFYGNKVLSGLQNLEENLEVFIGVISSHTMIGLALGRKGFYKEALERHKTALELSSKYFKEDNSITAKIHSNIGSVLFYIRDYDNAEKHLKVSMKIFESSENEFAYERSKVYNIIGSTYTSKGEFDKAFAFLIKSLKIRKKLHTENHSEVATVYNNIGIVFGKQKMYEQALEYFLKALQIRIQKLGAEHPDVANSYDNIIFILLENKDYMKAAFLSQNVYHIIHKTLGDDYPAIEEGYNIVAKVFEKQKDFERAIKHYEKAIEIAKKKSANNIKLAEYYFKIAQNYSSLNKYAFAIEAYGNAIKIKRISENYIDDDIIIYQTGIAYQYYLGGNYKTSAELYGQILDIYSKQEAANKKVVSNLIGMIAKNLCHIGEYKEATKYKLQQIRALEELGLKESDKYVKASNEMKVLLSNCKKVKSAEENYHDAESSYEKVKSKISSKSSKGSLKSKLKPSIEKANYALKIYEELGILENQTKCIKFLIGLYEIIGNQRLLKDYNKKLDALKTYQIQFEETPESHQSEHTHTFAADDMHEAGTDLLGDA